MLLLREEEVLSHSAIFGAKSKNLVSGMQGLPDSHTLEKAPVRQNLADLLWLNISGIGL